MLGSPNKSLRRPGWGTGHWLWGNPEHVTSEHTNPNHKVIPLYIYPLVNCSPYPSSLHPSCHMLPRHNTLLGLGLGLELMIGSEIVLGIGSGI